MRNVKQKTVWIFLCIVKLFAFKFTSSTGDFGASYLPPFNSRNMVENEKEKLEEMEVKIF